MTKKVPLKIDESTIIWVTEEYRSWYLGEPLDEEHEPAPEPKPAPVKRRFGKKKAAE